jgi:hypothetical protein
MVAEIARFPSRESFAVWIASGANGWLVLAHGHGWLHGDGSSALDDAAWLSNNLNLPVRAAPGIIKQQRNQSMAYEQRDLSGVLFKNESKTNEKHADYNGSITVNGEEFWLNAWLQTSKKGTRYMSLSLKPKKQQKTDQQKQPLADEMSDSIPF